jgi:hypothetical protein
MRQSNIPTGEANCIRGGCDANDPGARMEVYNRIIIMEIMGIMREIREQALRSKLKY